MLWGRFADPHGVLRTYTLAGAVSFLRYLIKKDNDDKVWEIWLHRKPKKTVGKEQQNMTFEEFKRASLILQRQNAAVVTPEEEAKRLEFASQFVKTHKETDHGNG